jgi:photosystem II stability/assembly factor-like uncharacterized protein
MLYGLYFVSPTEGWTVGWLGKVLHTTDGGMTWKTQNPDVYDELYSVYFINNQTGWISGQYGLILHTQDGGKTWKQQHSGTNVKLKKIYFASSSAGIAVGDQGMLITTQDGGKIWKKQDSGTTKNLKDISIGTDKLIAMGDDGIAVEYKIPMITQYSPRKLLFEESKAITVNLDFAQIY